MRTLLLLLVLASAACAQSQPAPQLSLMPLPSSFKLGVGQLAFDQEFSIALTGYKEDRLQRAVQRFVEQASRRTGMPMTLHLAESAKATLSIHTDHASKPIQEPGEDESYSLDVTPSGAKLSAATPLGILHGLQTFLQLIESTPAGFAVPVVTIHDTPRFVWRGLMIDVGRHFVPLDVIRRNLDGMEAVKMNVFHWHLSEDQGFRVESRKFPKLQELGSDGLYYSQEQVRDIIAYARDRGIRVLPEFDMPGHSTSWFVGYPDLASAPGPYQIERRWGIFDPAMDPTRDSTYKFLDQFIGEMTKLFPDPYFHIGGDEVNGKQWSANPKIQEFMRAHGIKSNAELQTYFTQRVQKLVSKRHKIMVGWDEILSPNIPKDIVIQSWRGQESLATAARQGYRGLLSNGYYIDLNWSAARHYAADPLGDGAAHLTAGEKQRILGGEATMWSEYVLSENIDSRIWPRTAAIAERLWSPQDVTDVTSMYRRLDQIRWRLDFLGLTHDTNYIPMLQRIADNRDVAPLRQLADVVEPVKDYNREQLASPPATQATPLNRLVDAARPESETARLFAVLVDRVIASRCSDASAVAEVRSLLSAWEANDGRLNPGSNNSFLLREAAPVSRNLSLTSQMGLGALDFLMKGEPAPDDWVKGQLANLNQAGKPTSAQLLLPIIAPAQKLIEASAHAGACSAK
ncbi:MAG TPA: family 20 glycosylhydrolase [Terriglobales bacterium]|nr:family 20 glycosylhydrolase [Terriglobales bacterium]